MRLHALHTRHHHRGPSTYVWLAAALVGGAVALPVVYLGVRTLGGGSEAWELLARVRTLQILGRTALLVLTVTAASIAIAVPLAWLTVRTDLPLRRLWAVLTALPLVIPSYVAGFLIVLALGPRGTLQDILEPLGVDRLPDIHGFTGAALTLTLLSYPYVLLPVRAALSRLDPSLEESSRGLGQGAWTTFIRVTMPMLRPAIVAGGLLVALYTLSDFGAVSLLRYETFTWAIYLQYDSAFDRTLAAGLSLTLVVLALGILFLASHTRGRAKYHRSSPGSARSAKQIALGRWRWPALGLTGALTALALAIPMAMLAYWVVRGVSAGEPLLFQWTAMRNSLYVSGLAALAAAGAGIPIAILSVRHPGRMSALLERTTYLGFALPGIAVALALVFFGTRFVLPLYQTTALLVFAYVVLFLPAAIGATRASLLQVPPRVEEAAQGLGRRPLTVFATITLPLIRRGILAGAALVFLLTMKELPATLILGPIGFKTLATSIWSSATDAFFAQAAAAALLLVAAASVPMAFLVLRERR